MDPYESKFSNRLAQALMPDAAAHPAPREGLPCRCFTAISHFDGRVAWWFTPDSLCPQCHGYRGLNTNASSSKRHHVAAGKYLGEIDGAPSSSVLSGIPFTHTDDPDEAAAAFERGAEWVRTGVLS